MNSGPPKYMTSYRNKRERWAKTPRRRAKWRRGYNRAIRAIVDGYTKRGWGYYRSLLLGSPQPEDRLSWRKFIKGWDDTFKDRS